MHAGILAANEGDFELAYSYFYESFDVYNLPLVRKPKKALKALEYMIIVKIMSGALDDVNNIILGKNAQKLYGREVEGLKLIEGCVRDKSVKRLKETIETYKDTLFADSVLIHHLHNLHNDLLEQNLIKIIEPYSVVEIEFITKLIGLQSFEIVSKLSQMILDKKINGILDQGKGSLIIYEETTNNAYLEKSFECFTNLNKVVESLFNKARSTNLN